MTLVSRKPSRRWLSAVIASTVCTAALAASTGAISPASAVDQPATTFAGSPDQAADAPHTATVDWLLSQLTVDEKLQLVKGGTDPNPHGEAGIILGVPRLGIPTIRHVDAQGVNVYKDSTAFPGRIGLAASFDRAALTTFGAAVGDEARALDVDLIYGPQVDMARMPTWGRNMTTYGEDPYLAAQLTDKEINAIQSTGLMAQVKHFTLYNGQNQNTPSIVGDQSAHELYYQASEAAVKDAGATSVMCSYANFQIRETESRPDFSCSNEGTLKGILKGLWDFKGWVTSDYGGSKATSDLLAGMDQEFATANFAPAKLKPLVDPTLDTYDPTYAAALDESVSRIVYQYERFGLLDDNLYPDDAKSPVKPIGPRPAVDKAKGIATARKLTEETAVLLKNDSKTLPLSRSASSKIAVLGPTANLMPAAPGGERSRGYGDRNNISPYDALTQNNGNTTISYAPGIDRVGTVVPTTSLLTSDAADAPSGLRLTETDPNGNVVSTRTVQTVDGKQTDLVKGNTYTYEGYVRVSSADTYRFWLARPAGSSFGDASQYNNGINPGLQQGGSRGGAANATLAVDDVAQTLTNPSTILQNTYPDGPTLNGQYLGLDNTGSSVALTPGVHKVKMTYKPAANTAAAPTFRFSWAAQQADLDAAVATAKAANQAVVFVDDGDTTTTPGDVGTLGPDQDKLIQAVADANPNTVVVLNTNGAVKMPWLGSVKSVLEMWYPGQEGGTATANLLYGIANPSGKLPITFPASNSATPFGGHPERSVGVNGQITWSENLQMGYRWYVDNDVNPLFAFGAGLSYSTFTFSGLSVKRTSDAGLDVTVTAKNTSGVAGHAVPQVYVGPSSELPSGVDTTQRKLVQFERISLKPGESATRTMHVSARDLSSWDTGSQSWVLGTGERSVSVGASSQDIALTTTARVEATKPALSRPVATVRSGAVTVGAKMFTRGTVGLSWTPSVPGSSLGGYEIAVDGRVVASVAPGVRSTTVKGLRQGTRKITVRAVPSSDAVDGGVQTSGEVTVVVDTKAPTTRLKKPSSSKVRAWKTLRGTISDGSGSGPKSVTVRLVEKRGSSWYFYTGSSWKKASSASSAKRRAATVAATVRGTRWTLAVSGLKKGTVRVSCAGSDRVGNTSALKTYSRRIK